MNFEPTSQRSPAGKAAGTARAGRWGRGPAVRGGRVPAVKSSATPPPAPGAAISTGRKGGCRQEAGGDLQPAGRRKSASSLGFGAERRRPEEIPGNGGGVPGISILCHPRGPDGPRPLAHAASPRTLPPPSSTPDPRERHLHQDGGGVVTRREISRRVVDFVGDSDASGTRQEVPDAPILSRRVADFVGDPDGLGHLWAEVLLCLGNHFLLGTIFSWRCVCGRRVCGHPPPRPAAAASAGGRRPPPPRPARPPGARPRAPPGRAPRGGGGGLAAASRAHGHEHHPTPPSPSPRVHRGLTPRPGPVRRPTGPPGAPRQAGAGRHAAERAHRAAPEAARAAAGP